MTCFSSQATKKETKEERTDSYLERFQTIGNQLAGVKMQDNDAAYLQTLPQADSEIIQRYQNKLAQENAQIVSAKNRFEVNDSLKEYD